MPVGKEPEEREREKGRSRALSLQFPDGDAEAAGLVAQVFGDPRAGEDDDAGRHHGEHLVVAAERGGLRVFAPVWLEGDLSDTARFGPARRDAFSGQRKLNGTWSLIGDEEA
jgi:hypothetical protein